MERFIPVRQGIDIGSGFNVLSGEVRGVAVGGQIDVGTFSGQEADLTRDLPQGWRRCDDQDAAQQQRRGSVARGAELFLC